MSRLRTAIPLLILPLVLGLAACTAADANGDGSVSSDDPSVTPTGGGGAGDLGLQDYDRVDALAPIESAEVLTLESFPPQYRLAVTSGLPGGCAVFDRIEVTRTGDVFDVAVFNRMPAPGVDIACTAIYGYVDHTVTLDPYGAIVSGTEYTVHVNEQTITFVAE